MLLKDLGSKQGGLSSAFGKERMLKASNAARGDLGVRFSIDHLRSDAKVTEKEAAITENG